jgi:hypothetical protein
MVAQENVRTQLSSVQDVPFTGLRDGHYPPQALPAVWIPGIRGPE